MFRFVHILTLALFLTYSQSMLVMWSLYMVEKQDIIVYYENMDDHSEGLHHMLRLCDGQQSDHGNAMALLNMSHQDVPYCVSVVYTAGIPCRSVSPTRLLNDNLPPSPCEDAVFRPPCC